MNENQRKLLEAVFESLDQAGAQLLEGTMNDVPGIRDARQSVNDARNTINKILNQER